MTVQRCICQICTCGTHRCPQQPNVEENFVFYNGCLLTEYQENFTAHCTTSTCAGSKPQNGWQPLEGKMDSTTTFRIDYVPHEMTRRSPKAAMVYVPPKGTMMLTSTYSEDYREHPVQKYTVNKQTREYCPPAAKMVARSLYKEEFKPWCSKRCQSVRITDNLTVNQGKFGTTTTFKDDYSAKGSISRIESFKQIPQTRKSLPFDGTTNYKHDYIAHPVESREPRRKFRPSSASFHGLSAHMQDYKSISTEVPKPIEGKVTSESNCTSFQGTTEFHDQYKSWFLQPKQSHKVQNYRPPDGAMDFLSTTHADYVVHEYQLAKCVRPPVRDWVKDKEAFQGTSVMKEDYKAWGVTHQPQVVHVKERVKPPGAFEKANLRSCYRCKAGKKPNTCMHLSVQRTSSHEPKSKDSTGHTLPCQFCRATPF